MRLSSVFLASFTASLSLFASDPLQRQATTLSESPLCLTGVVSTINGSNIVALEDGKTAHFIFVQRPWSLRRGDLIRIRGKTIAVSDGEQREIADDIRVLGRGSPPEPVEATIPELEGGKFLNRRIAVSGTLVRAQRDDLDAEWLRLVLKDGSSFLSASTPLEHGLQHHLLANTDAKIRLTGTLLSSHGARLFPTHDLFVSTNDLIRILEPPPKDLFQVPRLATDRCQLDAAHSAATRLRFDGKVLAVWGENHVLLAGTGNTTRVHAILSNRSALPRIGQDIAVSGFAEPDAFGLNLIFSEWTPLPFPLTGVHDLAPVDVAIRDLLVDGLGRKRVNGYSHGRILRLTGKLIDIQPSLRLFTLGDGGGTLPVNYSAFPDALDGVLPGTTLTVEAAALVETGTWSRNPLLAHTCDIRLVLHSPALAIRALPAWWTATRLVAVIVILLLIIVVIVIANRYLNRAITRRKVVERTRLAVELHDLLSQNLAGLAFQISAGRKAIDEDPTSASETLGFAERILESSRKELKNCLFDLRNDTMDNRDFAAAIRKTVEVLGNQTRISIRCPVDRSRLDDLLAHNLLCVIRELTANAIRHGKATSVRIAGAAEQGRLLFSVSDNGVGFRPEDAPGPLQGHFGLVGIRDRLKHINGTLDISSSPGQTRATITITL